jgi:site-specific recombinase XerD
VGRENEKFRPNYLVKKMEGFELKPLIIIAGVPGGIRTHGPLLRRQLHEAKLLNKLSVTHIAELSNFSKAYISQVKHGKRPPSQKLLDALAEQIEQKKPQIDYLNLFLESRTAMGVSPRTIEFYKDRLYKFAYKVNYLKASPQSIQRYLNSIHANNNGFATRHASFRAIKTFYRWLDAEYGLNNPMANLAAPILSKPILPSLTEEQVLTLIDRVSNSRDKAIISLFAESGLRLSELTNIKTEDIQWGNRVVRVLGKGRKEGFAPFGELSGRYLKEWLSEYQPNGNIWGLKKRGVAIMLKRLEKETGLPCNPHTFRRTFACLLRKAGVDTMTIKDLGRWESLEMVQRYTRSVTFQDSLRFYKAPLG